MPARPVLECVVNVSEGTDLHVIRALAKASGTSLLDIHADSHHNRSVFTLAGPEVEVDVRSLARAGVEHIDVSSHTGVHPRIGAVDVVPFVPLPDTGATMHEAVAARNAFAAWMHKELGITCLLYGPERSLPELRKMAPPITTRTGSCAVGARGFLIAFNLWLRDTPLPVAQQIARAIRRPTLRTLALPVGEAVQISCNLVEPVGPNAIGPAEAYNAVAALAEIEKSELVGLIPQAVLSPIPKSRWGVLDLGEDKVIEARLLTHYSFETGFNPGK